MTVAVIPDLPAAEPVYVSDDAAYDWQAQAGPLTSRWKADASGVLGMLSGGPYRLGMHLLGFTATNERATGNVVSFSAREAAAVVTYQVTAGQVKERIKLLAPPPVSTFTIALSPTNAHIEQAADGGLYAWSDLDGSLIARVPAPTCVDANGVSGPARYRLSPDARTLYLDLDAGWLASAAYPVRVDPTVITNAASLYSASLDPTQAGHIFRMSDGKLIAVWTDNNGSVTRSTSTDGGSTWTTAAIVFSSTNGALVAAVANGDTIYGVYTLNYLTLKAFKMVYATGAFTDTSATIAYSQTLAGGIVRADCRFDTVKSALHVQFSGNSLSVLVAISTSLTLLAEYDISASNGAFNAVTVDGATTPNVYACYQSASGNLVVLPLTFSGSAYTSGTAETTGANVSGVTVACALDSTSKLDLFWTDGTAIKTMKRTGTATYSAVTTLVASGSTATSAPGVCRTNNVNADVILVYATNAGQTNGEIYQIKRLAGAWQAAALVAGGSNVGWQRPTAITDIASDNKIHLLYFTPVSPLAIVYDGSLVNGNAPSASINNLPSGNANTSLTPTCSCTYKNTVAGDALGKYRVLVTRQSDSAVMWDTGSSGTTWGGATITDGGTFSITYAGSALSKGITYLVQFQFWDSIGGLAGPLSTAVTFQINDAPTVTITGPTPFNAEITSGLSVTWTYAQTLGHAQASFQVKVLNAGQTATIYDSGVQTGAATSWTVPTGTLANNTAYVLSVTATSSDGL